MFISSFLDLFSFKLPEIAILQVYLLCSPVKFPIDMWAELQFIKDERPHRNSTKKTEISIRLGEPDSRFQWLSKKENHKIQEMTYEVVVTTQNHGEHLLS